MTKFKAIVQFGDKNNRYVKDVRAFILEKGNTYNIL